MSERASDREQRSRRTIAYYNRLYAQGKLEFRLVSGDELLVLLGKCDRLRWPLLAECTIEVVEPVFEDAYLFRLGDPEIRYLFYDPVTENEHWADEHFEDIHYNVAKAYFGSQATGTDKAHLERLFGQVDARDNN